MASVPRKFKGSTSLLQDVDHRDFEVQDRPALALNPEFLQSLCRSCHRKKTAKTRRFCPLPWLSLAISRSSPRRWGYAKAFLRSPVKETMFERAPRLP